VPVLLSYAFDADAAMRALKALGDDAPTAIYRALNRTIKTARTYAKREIARAIGLTQKQVSGNLKIKQAYVGNLAATLTARGGPITRLAFGARQTAHGVTFKTGAGRVTLEHAFLLPKLPRGRPGVFLRGGRERTPIHSQFGPSVPEIVETEQLFAAMEPLTTIEFRKHLTREITFLLHRR
jgi:hypothetical protein